MVRSQSMLVEGTEGLVSKKKSSYSLCTRFGMHMGPIREYVVSALDL